MNAALVEGIDFYWEGDKFVFTAAYHQKRGYCCNSKCRHCPWREAREARRSLLVGHAAENADGAGSAPGRASTKPR